jgi:hypothetical protein
MEARTQPQPDYPASFRFYENRHGRDGRKLAKALSRFVSGDLSLPDSVIHDMGRDRARADPLSDTFIEAAFANGYARDARKLVETALQTGIDSLPDPPVELTALFTHLDAEPDWLDWDQVEKGARVFRRYGTDAYVYFGAFSLEGYRRESIFKPLVLTGAYTGGSAFGRYLETCRFWTDVSEPGSLRQGGEGRKTAVLVRVMHSMIRRHIEPHAEWDTPRLGQPLNQSDQFATITLSFLLTEHGRLLGYWPTEDEILAHMHFWRYIAYLMGVEPAFYPDNVEDWWRVVYTILISGDLADGEDSKHLGQSFVEAFGPTGKETPKRAKAKEREQNKILGYTRYFLSQDTFQAHDLPPAGVHRWIPLLYLAPNFAGDVARRVIPGVGKRIDDRQRHKRSAWLERHLAGRTARFSPVDTLAR